MVAADKGTATFSDIANSIAIEKNYWLGDASHLAVRLVMIIRKLGLLLAAPGFLLEDSFKN